MAEEESQDAPEGGDEPELPEEIQEIDEEGAEEATGGKSRKKLLAVIAAAIIVLLSGTGGTLYFLGALDPLLGTQHAADDVGEDTAIDLGTPVYYDLPEQLADLKTGQCRAPFLKFQVTVQVYERDLPIVKQQQPKIIDRTQQLLREQMRQDLVGKEGAEALRANLVLIINNAIKPAQVHNVLFKQFVLQ